jgi:hypothetical protein
MKLTTHFNLAPTSRMRGGIALLNQYVLIAWCSVKEKAQGQFYIYLLHIYNECSRNPALSLSRSLYIYKITMLVSSTCLCTKKIYMLVFNIFLPPLIANALGQWYSTFCPPVPLETLLHSTLYPQSCWCKISLLSRVGNARNRKQYKFTLERNVIL